MRTITEMPPTVAPAFVPPDPPTRRRRPGRGVLLVVLVVLVAAAVAVTRWPAPDTSTADPGAAAVSPAVLAPADLAPAVLTPTPGAVVDSAPDATRETAPGAVVPTDPATSAPAVPQEESAAAQPAGASTRWRPEAGLTWQWQLSVPVDQTVDADVYDIDMFENDAAVVASLHAAGRKVICYIDVGGWEDYRADAADFPTAVLGKAIDGWPSERWLDIRRLDVLRPLMAARFDECAAKGFDGVEPDLVDAAAADTGFALTRADQLAYNLMIAELAHERGLAVGLKNDLTQIPQLVGTFDFAVNEQCSEYSECTMLLPFIAAGKPVFHAEYDVPTTVFCEESQRLGFSSIRKQLDLGAWLETCS